MELVLDGLSKVENLDSSGTIGIASRALCPGRAAPIPVRSRLNDRFDDAIDQFDFLRFRLVQKGIEPPSEGLLTLFAFEEQQMMGWDTKRPGHRSDCIQARHLSASLYLAPIIPAKPGALSSLLQAKLFSLPEPPNALAEQCSSIVHICRKQQ